VTGSRLDAARQIGSMTMPLPAIARVACGTNGWIDGP
jgi:hypothetical protein